MTPQGAFHWINAICIICLVLLGTIMMFREDLGFISLESKIALKRVHSYIGYVFVLNLVLRAVAGMKIKSNRPLRLHLGSLLQFVVSFVKGVPVEANTKRRSSDTITLVLFILMTVSAVTGLIRTGTDVYLPPVGFLATRWLADSPELASTLDPLSEEHVNQSQLSRLNRVKVPIGLIHKWSAYTMLAALLMHILLAIELSRRTAGQPTARNPAGEQDT